MEHMQTTRKQRQRQSHGQSKKDTTLEGYPLPIVQQWSAKRSENVEVLDIHPSVPLDIALLHIKTDELLESLRQSAITPKCRDQVSPTSTKSTFECTVEHDSCLSSIDNKSEKGNRQVTDIQEQDCKSMSSVDSDDDGMKWEIEQLNNITLEMEQSISEFIMSSKTCPIADENQQLHSDCIGVDSLDNVFLLLWRDIFVLFEDISMMIIRSSTVNMMASSINARFLFQSDQSRPRYVLVSSYIIVSMAYLCVKVAWKHTW